MSSEDRLFLFLVPLLAVQTPSLLILDVLHSIGILTLSNSCYLVKGCLFSASVISEIYVVSRPMQPLSLLQRAKIRIQKTMEKWMNSNSILSNLFPVHVCA